MQRLGLYLFVVILTAAAFATPITYTESVNAGGKLGASSFTNALVTVTLNADTATITNPFAGIFVNLAQPPATVTITGIGTAIFSDKMETVVNQNLGEGGASDFTTNFLTLFTINSGSFSTYALGGPVTIVGSPQINFSVSFATNLGNLLLTSVSGNSTFTASTSVPEPSNAILVGWGLGLLVVSLGIIRRNRAF